MKKYELLVFDFDGTLVDTVEDIAYYANAVLIEYGCESQPVARVRQEIGLGVHELLKGLAPEFEGGAARLEEAVNLFKKMYRQQPVRKSDAFESVRSVLAGPLAKTKKAIVTNKPQDITEQILKELGLETYFEAVIGMHAGFSPKPDPTSLLHVINRLATPLEKSIFIGDSGVDAATAENARVDFAWVSYGYDQPKNISSAARFDSASQWAVLV